MKPHKHAALIHAWAEGNEIECYDFENKQWHASNTPSWLGHLHYRVKLKEPEWYENIPEHGVLCWVSDALTTPSTNSRLRIVKDVYKDGFRTMDGTPWVYATPLTNDEIRQFLRGE